MLVVNFERIRNQGRDTSGCIGEGWVSASVSVSVSVSIDIRHCKVGKSLASDPIEIHVQLMDLSSIHQ